MVDAVKFTVTLRKWPLILMLLLLLLPLALRPAVGFGLSNNISPFALIYHQLSPSSHSQHLKISFHFFCLSFPSSSSSSRPFQFWVKMFLAILSSSMLSRWPSQLILCPFINFTIFSPLFNSSSSRFVLLFHSPSSYLGPFHSFSSLSYDRSKASSKASSPHTAIQSFLFQMRVSSPFLKVIQ